MSNVSVEWQPSKRSNWSTGDEQARVGNYRLYVRRMSESTMWSWYVEHPASGDIANGKARSSTVAKACCAAVVSAVLRPRREKVTP